MGRKIVMKDFVQRIAEVSNQYFKVRKKFKNGVSIACEGVIALICKVLNRQKFQV